MNTKRPILQFFAEQLPQFEFVGERRPNLIFRFERPNGLFWMIALQRDGASCGLAVQLAATYDPNWRGEPAITVGIDTGLANLRLRSPAVDVREVRMFYEPTVDGLTKILVEIGHQVEKLGLPFLKDAEARLRSNRLLQAALVAASQVPANARRGLQEELVSVGYRLDALTHPAYIQMRNYLTGLITPQVPEKERRSVNRLACDCLLLIPPSNSS